MVERVDRSKRGRRGAALQRPTPARARRCCSLLALLELVDVFDGRKCAVFFVCPNATGSLCACSVRTDEEHGALSAVEDVHQLQQRCGQSGRGAAVGSPSP
jgi:hypothetical protein